MIKKHKKILNNSQKFKKMSEFNKLAFETEHLNT
jgi:hypothetical protein